MSKYITRKMTPVVNRRQNLCYKVKRSKSLIISIISLLTASEESSKQVDGDGAADRVIPASLSSIMDCILCSNSGRDRELILIWGWLSSDSSG